MNVLGTSEEHDGNSAPIKAKQTQNVNQIRKIIGQKFVRE